MPKPDPDRTNVVPLKPAACPACGKPGTTTYKPFCSKRCADLDLGRWLNESYTIVSSDDDDPAEGDQA